MYKSWWIFAWTFLGRFSIQPVQWIKFHQYLLFPWQLEELPMIFFLKLQCLEIMVQPEVLYKPGVTCLYIDISELKNCLLWKHMSLSLDIWLVSLSSRSLSRLFKQYHVGCNDPDPGVTCFTGYLEKKSPFLKLHAVKFRYFLCNITDWSSNKTEQITCLGTKFIAPVHFV